MSKFLDEPMATVALPSKAHRLPSGLLPSDARSGQPQSTLVADDPALLIGLALACVRQETAFGGVVPKPILMRLTAHARLGNPSACLVLGWLTRRNHRNVTSPAPETVRTADVRPERKFPRDRVMERLAGPAPEDVRPRGRKRPRWPAGKDNASANPETVSDLTEVQHG